MVEITDNRAQVLAALRAAEAAALEAAGQQITEAARAAAPVDSGALRDSIQYQIDGNQLTVAAAAPYAAVVELGGPGRRVQPFLGPAMQGKAADALRSVLQAR